MLSAMFVAFSSVAGTTTTEDAENYRALCLSFVKTEGYTPSIDSDGDIKFKHDGDPYWVEITPYDDGYYVSLITFTSIENYSITKVRKAMDETMRGLKYVRIYTSSNGKFVTVGYHWYCVSIQDFKRMFDNALIVVSTADSRFRNSVISD